MPNEFTTFQFIECDKYMTTGGYVTFNFDYVIKKSKIYWNKGYIENQFLDPCFRNVPNIPHGEFNWFICPMYLKIVDMQYSYFDIFLHYDEQDIIPLDDIDELIKDYLMNKEESSRSDLEWNDEIIRKLVKNTI
jgi:hypothetical protein